MDYLEYADQARTEKQNYKSHLGGNVYCTITEGSACMDIRQYWKPQEEVIPRFGVMAPIDCFIFEHSIDLEIYLPLACRILKRQR